METKLTETLLEKYSALQEELKITLEKGEQGRGFRYTSLPDILSECKPLLSKHGLVLFQTNTGSPEIGVGITTTIFEIKGGGLISNTITVPFSVSEQRGVKEDNLVMTRIQSVGATLTYLRRYCVVTILGMGTEDDADNKNIFREQKRKDEKTISAEQANKLLAADKNNLLPGLLKLAGFESALDVSVNRFQKLYKLIEDGNKEKK